MKQMPDAGWDTRDTIVAKATAPAGAPRGVIRISGPRALQCLAAISESSEDWMQAKAARRATTRLRLSAIHSAIPADLLLWPNERSYTRQPTVEIHTIGSPPLLEAIAEAICRQGARAAEPGEFTLRAFLAGRLDLTQAEAVLGVIDASTQEDLDDALRQLAGGLTTPLHRLRDTLLDVLAHLEAGLDFVEEDIEFITREDLLRQLAAVEAQLQQMQKQLSEQALRRELPSVVLCGEPNAGKSSLFNALLQQEAAIVSPQRGATRDYLIAEWRPQDDCCCRLIDTAGLDAGAAGPDAVAQQLSHEAVQNATVRVYCVAPSDPPAIPDWLGAQDLVTETKCDQAESSHRIAGAILTSAFRGEGLNDLRSAIANRLAHAAPGILEGTAVRCGGSLTEIEEFVRNARRAAEDEFGEELVAAELRGALDSLGRIVGAIYNDDVLDRVFSRFCIGK